MKMKLAALGTLAVALSVGGMVAPAAAGIINAPVPIANYITFGGNDWAWAMPCPPVEEGGVVCGSGPVLDLTYQSTQGWHLPTAAEFAAGPTAADFGTADSFKCASAWFNSTYTHCDYGDAAGGAVYGSPGGGNWYDETWVTRAGSAGVPEPATWAMMIGGLAMVGYAARRRRGTVAFAG